MNNSIVPMGFDLSSPPNAPLAGPIRTILEVSVVVVSFVGNVKVSLNEPLSWLLAEYSVPEKLIATEYALVSGRKFALSWKRTAPVTKMSDPPAA